MNAHNEAHKQAAESVEDNLVLLADSINQLAMAVESLATLTGHTELSYAKAIRRAVKQVTLEIRESLESLIPD